MALAQATRPVTAAVQQIYESAVPPLQAGCSLLQAAAARAAARLSAQISGERVAQAAALQVLTVRCLAPAPAGPTKPQTMAVAAHSPPGVLLARSAAMEVAQAAWVKVETPGLPTVITAAVAAAVITAAGPLLNLAAAAAAAAIQTAVIAQALPLLRAMLPAMVALL